MSVQQLKSIVLALSVTLAATTGCAATGRWPFSFHSSRDAAVQDQAAISAPTPNSPGAAAPAANDAVSKQIAAESRALSSAFSIASDPEQQKFSAASGGTGGESAKSDNPPESFTSASSASSHGCSSGCCR